MSSSPPTTLGKYQIIREIARSNDIVYEAWDPGMNRRVAVKELAMPSGASQSQREDRLKRFLREARAAGSLTHPNIVTVFEVGEDQGRTFIAMEYLDGRTLRAEMDQSGFLPPTRAIEIAQEVLKGLAFAHSKGVIHRDIKPENIQLLEGGAVKITDFGIARLTFEPNITMDGQVFGTPSYMSPEQIGGKELDARSDLFSVGIILYEALSGQKAFPGDSVVSITYAIMNKEPEYLSSIPYPVWQVVEQALNKIPTMRFSTAESMRSALARATLSLGSDPNPASQIPSVFGVAPPIQAPPIQNQGGWQPGQVLSQPYQPYGQGGYGQAPQQQQGAYQPYSSPYAGQYSQPQVGYPPQQAGGGIGQPYSPYSGQPQAGPAGLPPVPGVPGMPFPVYYPPPPKRPLIEFNPEKVRAFIKVVMLTGLVITAVALIIMFLKQLGEQQAVSGSQPVPFTSPNSADTQAAAPPDLTAEQPQNPEVAQTQPPALKLRSNPSGPSAFDWFSNGEDLAYQASQEPIDDARRRLWNDSSVSFLKAVESDPAQSSRTREAAVFALLARAEQLAAQGNFRRAREAAQAADGVATGSAALQKVTQEALARYGA